MSDFAFCHTCLRRSATLACSQCLDRIYCSEECADLDWYSRGGHHLYCGKPIDLTTLQSLKDRLPLEVKDRSPTTIDGWLFIRNRLAELDASLQREIDAYKVTENDVDEHLEDVVFLSNLTSSGPLVMQSPGKGYGLFAEKDYSGSLEDKGEYVTTYGGTPLRGNMQGEYILEIQPNYSIDGHHGFALSEKGRWMNHASQDFNVYWARNRVHVYTPDYEHACAPVIEKGSELLVSYGDEYVKPWEQGADHPQRSEQDTLRLQRWEETRKQWKRRKADPQDFE